MKYAGVFFIFIAAILLLYWLIHASWTGKTKALPQLNHEPEKPVIVIIVDSLMDVPLQNAMKTGQTPAMEFLIENGSYEPNVVSGFPTMSVSLDSTLLTGKYPDEHKVPALVWFNQKENQFVSYGSARSEIMKVGVTKILENSLYHLNNTHLSKGVKTIHEDMNEAGLQTASINALMYRANTEKEFNFPWFFNPLSKDQQIKASDFFSFGILSKYKKGNKHTHAWKGFGINDTFAAEELSYLIEQNKLPSFSLVYFSNNDKKVHKKGIQETQGIIDADKELQKVLNTYPSWSEAINSNIWVVMGDSGQTAVLNEKETALIDLRSILTNYQIYEISKPIQKDDQIVLGLNERMSFIYLLDSQIQRNHVIDQLKTDNRIANISWQDGERIRVISPDSSSGLSFKRGGPLKDCYDQTWTVEGNLAVLDLTIQADGILGYHDYPDGLERLYTSFHSHEGDFLIVNAKPGYEFIGEGSPTHIGGGSHGSLHKQDTLFPMIIAGTDSKPKYNRIVDLKEWFMSLANPNK